MDINAAIQAQASAHPFYAFAIGCVVGPLWPRAINWLVTDGVDWIVPKVLTAQKFYLKKFGGTDEQIKAVELREAQALARASADVAMDANNAAPAGTPLVAPQMQNAPPAQ